MSTDQDSAEPPVTLLITRDKDGGLPRRRLREYRLTAPSGTVTVASPRFRVGSHRGNDLVLDHQTVSRFHLEIEATPAGFLLRDLGSTNGTWIDGLQVREAYLPARAGVRAAQVQLRFELTEQQTEIDAEAGEEFHGLLGRSAAMREIFTVLARAAPTDATVLVEGESGTGKEEVAAALHRASRRSGGPLVFVDCAAIPSTLLESEFFGHERGAFTGAVARHDGRFHEANGGTLVLDEIGEMPLEVQPKLLRVLESKQVRRVGSTAAERVDVRLVASTNRDLAREVNRGTFREDLYYRLAVVRVKLPPLRERPEDIRPLAAHFIRKLHAGQPLQAEEAIRGVSEANWRKLESMPWPGNVRELRNVLERALILSDQPLASIPGPSLGAHEAPVRPSGSPLATAPPPVAVDLERPFNELKNETIAAFERAYLLGQLEKHGNISAAARAAGMDRMNFKRLLRRYR
jgi:DNA-binding NtrC family response regulator